MREFLTCQCDAHILQRWAAGMYVGFLGLLMLLTWAFANR